MKRRINQIIFQCEYCHQELQKPFVQKIGIDQLFLLEVDNEEIPETV